VSVCPCFAIVDAEFLKTDSLQDSPVANGSSAKQIPCFHWASVSRNANHDALMAWPAERPMETACLMSNSEQTAHHKSAGFSICV
jgi:hypothetical protein